MNSMNGTIMGHGLWDDNIIQAHMLYGYHTTTITSVQQEYYKRTKKKLLIPIKIGTCRVFKYFIIVSIMKYRFRKNCKQLV